MARTGYAWAGSRLRRWAASGALAITLLPLSAAIRLPAVSAANDFCARLGQRSLVASAGAHMYCDFKATSLANGARSRVAAPKNETNGERNSQNPPRRFGNNVDAGNPQEDITPSLAQMYGQSEVSTAAIGPYVVEAWNDATALAAPCPSPMYKEELSGYGFSSDGGRTFTDMGGLPNDCTSGFQYFGDPSVETWQVGGKTYFYISGLYINNATGQSDLAMDACTVVGAGSSATLSCGMPVVVASGAVAAKASDFLDKEYLSIDPANQRLYMSYTRFGAFGTPTFNGEIELAVCNISTADAPVCFPGSSEAPYMVVAPPNPDCEQEGSYPAVHVRTGAVYVAWEFNVATNIFSGGTSCGTQPTQNRVAYIPFACLTLTPTSPCVTTPRTQAINIVGISAAMIPGYTRFPMQDFPRIAVSDRAGTVSIVWNDARRIPTADVLLQSFQLVTLNRIQDAPVRLNADPGFKWNVLPALRNADSEGRLNVSWYQQREPGALTDVLAALRLDPRIEDTPQNVRVTTEPTGWHDASSDIGPNFGDYTDNYVLATPNAPYTDQSLFVAWSDGRMGLPQPFNARLDSNGDNGGNGQ